MKKLYVLFLFVLLSLLSWSQQRYEKGYIVNLEGDTVFGNIRYENWLSNPSAINFKLTENDKPTVYKPNEIQSFQVHNEIYISSLIEVEVSRRNVELLDDNPKLKLKQKSVFLNIIVSGEKKLAAYSEYSGNDNFYIFYEGKYQLLVYKKYLMNTNQKQLIQEDKKFIGQLMVYLADCDKIIPKIQTAKYTRQSLQRLFAYYYSSCLGIQTTHIQKIEKDVISYRAIIGLNNTKLNFEGQINYLADVDFPSSTNFTFGAAIDIGFRRSKNKYILINELIYTSYQTTGFYDVNLHYNYDIELGLKQINLNTLFRYNFPIKETSIFVNMGLANAFLLKFDNKLVTTNTFNGKVRHLKALDEYRIWELGGLLGLGVGWRKWSVEFRTQLSLGMSDYVTLSSYTTKGFLFLNYRFGKIKK